jgi:hypothetical protein
MFRVPLTPSTARAPSNYVPIFHKSIIPLTARTQSNYVASDLMPVLLEITWKIFMRQSFHMLLVLLGTKWQYFMSQS